MTDEKGKKNKSATAKTCVKADVAKVAAIHSDDDDDASQDVVSSGKV